MAAITQNTKRRIKDTGLRMIYALKDDTRIYGGSLVGIDTDTPEGYARPYQNNGASAADEFVGIALEEQDNTGGADADLHIEVVTEGILEDIDVTGAADGVQELGNLVYATDSGVPTLTSTNNSKIGQVIGYNADTDKYSVFFKSQLMQGL